MRKTIECPPRFCWWLCTIIFFEKKRISSACPRVGQELLEVMNIVGISMSWFPKDVRSDYKLNPSKSRIFFVPFLGFYFHDRGFNNGLYDTCFFMNTFLKGIVTC